MSQGEKIPHLAQVCSVGLSTGYLCLSSLSIDILSMTYMTNVDYLNK